MAHPPAQVPPRVTPQHPVPHGGRPPSMEQNPVPEQPAPEEPPGPPENVYPCGCAYPGPHKQDCMWSLWEQMRDNYTQTRTLMGKFMSQVNTMQDTAGEKAKCECPAGCHGTDLGEAMGLQQMAGVTVPWNMALGAGAFGGPMGQGGSGAAPQSYPVENEARKLMEEQKRIKSMWTQFFNIFDMALDLANDVSKDRWKQNRNRKERQRLEREQRLEEMRKERQERQKGSKPSPPLPKDEKPTDKDDKTNKKTEEQPQEKPEEESEPPKEDQTEDEPAAETEPAAEEEEEEAE